MQERCADIERCMKVVVVNAHQREQDVLDMMQRNKGGLLGELTYLLYDNRVFHVAYASIHRGGL